MANLTLDVTERVVTVVALVLSYFTGRLYGPRYNGKRKKKKTSRF
jgi:predicted site-specific integrase-resolvase